MAIKRLSTRLSSSTSSLNDKVIASGGETYSISGYKIHIFKDYAAATNFTVTRAGSIELLVIAGGGAGSVDHGGAGGAGGLLYASSYSVSPGNYSETIGKGARSIVASYLGVYSQNLSGTPDTQGSGISGRAYGPANSGGNTVFGSITAIGGGGGSGFGYGTTRAGDGGSGGGAGAASNQLGGEKTQGNSGGVTGYGSNGGADTGGVSGGDCGGGGGGAGGPGINGTATVGGATAGDGGPGLTYSISGTSRGYAGGGGGGGHNSGNIGEATHGGGWGDGRSNQDGTAFGYGTPGTGGGGGGRSNDGQHSGNGGSGIVIVRYLE